MGEEGRSADRWSEWLSHRRFGGDRDLRRQTLDHLRGVRDRILDQAELVPSDTVLDVGCGEGLVAFGALERGASLAIFSDISAALLEVGERAARGGGVSEPCRCVRTSTDDLSAMEDANVDVVTTRSVLIYVDDKPRAFEEFHRVLRPGGRISLFEPINRLNRFLRCYDAT